MNRDRPEARTPAGDDESPPTRKMAKIERPLHFDDGRHDAVLWRRLGLRAYEHSQHIIMGRSTKLPGKARAAASSQTGRNAPRRKSTPLSRSARETPRRSVTPLDALELATQKWLSGERLDIGRLADELGVGRTTLFRWVGTREQLYGEVLRKLYAGQRSYLLQTARGKGLDLLENVVRRNLEALATSVPLQRFIDQDPEFAIRLLTSPHGSAQQHSIEVEVELLKRVLAEGKISPQLDLHALAHIIVRIGEAFLYAGAIGGQKPDLDTFVAAIRILASAQKRDADKRRRSKKTTGR